MLDWLSAPTGSAPVKTAHDDGDRSGFEEPPETPAHLFAVRAFKTALFGTPAPPPTIHESRGIPQPLESAARDVEEADIDNENTAALAEELKVENARRRDPFSSPSKGILMTPGTGAARRKSVSFVAKTNQPTNNNTDNGIVLGEDVGSRPLQLRLKRKVDLRRNLFEPRTNLASESVAPVDFNQLPQTIPSQTGSSNNLQHMLTEDKTNTSENPADVTVDLKSPRSKSGQHWKREYQRDHDKSKLEMRKLIRYGQAAKSYAVKRDQEAIRLGEKLRQTEEQVRDMEGKVSELASELANARLHDENQARILEDLASQTTQALRYKQKAERYRIALRDSNPSTSVRDNALQLSSQEFLENPTARLEVQSLRAAAEQAERRAAELEKKNASLKHDLAKAKGDLISSEDRYQKSMERRKEREEKLVADKKALKEQLSKLALESRTNPHLENESKDESKPRASINRDKSADLRVKRGASQMETTERKQARKALLDVQSADFHGRKPTTKNTAPVGIVRRAERHNSVAPNENLGFIETESSSINRRFSERSIELPRGGAKPLESSDLWMNLDNRSVDSDSYPSLPVPRALAPISHNSASHPATLATESHITNTPARGRGSELLSSSLSAGGTVRKPLPADRVAAAKRRIQQRMAEKRKTQESTKENIRRKT